MDLAEIQEKWGEADMSLTLIGGYVDMKKRHAAI